MKIEQSDVEVFDLHAGRIDFREGVLDALDCLLAFGLAPRQMDHVQKCTAVQEHAVSCFLKFGICLFDHLLTMNRLLEQSLEDRQQRLCFVESESAVGHVPYNSF